MILITVGTHYQPFERLVKAGDEYASNTDEKVIIQYGVTKFTCQYAESFDFCPKENMADLIEKSDILIMQGGWGALREAIDKHKRIVAVPRIEGLEHVHDQEQIVRKLEQLGCVIGVYDISKLGDAIEKARTFDFQSLKHGNASIIKTTIDEWFSYKK